MEGRGRAVGAVRGGVATLGVALSLVLLLGPGAASALSTAVEFSLRDGPPPDGTADDLFQEPDSNFGNNFQSALFDAETYVEFSLAGAATETEVRLALGVSATGSSFIYGESKTFKVSTYTGTGTATLSVFGQGSLLESVALPSNGVFALDLDVTDAWNDAVTAGDDFLGIRIHDPVWTGTIVGAGSIIYGSAELDVVPEPATTSMLGFSLAALGWRARRRRPAGARAQRTAATGRVLRSA